MKPLSFIIITYNRPDDVLELLQNISKLNKASELLEDIIVVNNASSEDYSAAKHFVSSSPLPFQFIDAPSNLGVTKGRNFALQYARGNILIFLDDDAMLQNKDALENVITAFNNVGPGERTVAIVTFKVLYYDTLTLQENTLPNKNIEKYRNKTSFFTYYFAGGAHAIRREVLHAVGNLPEEFFYGMEEYDLSYRIIDKGYCIRYDSSIVMLHKESPMGRKPKSEKLRMMWVNKSKVAWRYLPKRYFYSTAVMWSFEYLRKTSFHLKGYLSTWKEIFSIPFHEKRTPITSSSIKYLREVEARLWY